MKRRKNISVDNLNPKIVRHWTYVTFSVAKLMGAKYLGLSGRREHMAILRDGKEFLLRPGMITSHGLLEAIKTDHAQPPEA